MPADLMKALREKLNFKDLTVAYGMSKPFPAFELRLVCVDAYIAENVMSFTTKMTDPVEEKTTTVGTVLPHLKVKLIDKKGVTVPTGVPGEVLTAGYALTKGHASFTFQCFPRLILKHRYWNEPEKTRAVMPTDSEGTIWMQSGDLGIMNEHGYLKSELLLTRF